jgi:predicted amidohydrolase YtcJ
MLPVYLHAVIMKITLIYQHFNNPAGPLQPWAEALKITDNRITLVGSNAEVKKVCGKHTTMLDLPGRLVTPGLVDAHCHFLNLGRSFQ